MNELSYAVRTRKIALKWAVKSFTDLEQPRNVQGYSAGDRRQGPSTAEVVTRSKEFENFLNGTTNET